MISLKGLDVHIPDSTAFIGGLSLDGRVQPVEGMLPGVLSAKKLGIKKLYMPYDEKLPQLEFREMEIIYVTSLEDVIKHLNGQELIQLLPEVMKKESPVIYNDFNKIAGHSFAKYALEVAAAGEHYLFMTGPPGCGKSLLAETFPSIMPPLSKEAQLEMSLYQLSGSSWNQAAVPPFRHPHHSASSVSIIGGGQYPRPGEVSLAHRGVLFLDEMAEFTRKTLDMMRQPLESGRVSISRTQASVTYPASFILIGAMNPCPCGYANSSSRYCTCTPKQITAYQNKLSGPLRDRFDINLSLHPVRLKSISEENTYSSSMIRSRVEEARSRQYERYGKETGNGKVSYAELLNSSPLTPEQQRNLQQISIKKNWSNRAHIKIIRLARTVSDLQGSKDISDQSIWEAIKLNSSPEVGRKRDGSLMIKG